MRALGAASVLAVTFLTGCSSLLPSPGPSPSPEGRRLPNPTVISNVTEVPVTIVIDGAEVLVVSANSEARVPVRTMPPLPFELEARLDDGRVIATQLVADTDSLFVRVGLTCGVLDIWSSAEQPLGPRPDPANDIDCASPGTS
jgi:hypothetical protein